MLVIEPVTLSGTFVRLEPLDVHHAGDLFKIGQDERVWRYLTREPLTSEGDARDWILEALEGRHSGSQLPFAIVHLASNRLAGTTRYLNICPADRGARNRLDVAQLGVSTHDG